MASAREKIEAVLSTFWDEQAIPVAEVGSNSSVDEMTVPLDSISSCEVLILIEPILGRKIEAAQVIKKGGYASKEEFVHTLTQAVLDTGSDVS